MGEKINPFPTSLQSAQPSYQLLVANFTKAHTPEVGTTGSNPIRSRSGFEFQNTSFLSFGPPGAAGMNIPVATGTGSLMTSPPSTHQTGTVTVANNDFSTGRAELHVGQFVLVEGDDFTVGGSTALTATAIAAAIANLPGFGGTIAAASDVEVDGPLGSQPLTWKTRVFGTIANFSAITPDSGFLAPGDPQRGGTVILPA